MNKTRSIAAVSTIGLIALLGLSIACNNDINKSSAPVELLMHTTTQAIQTFDLNATTSTACTQNVSEFQIENRVKNPATTNTSFLDVRLTRYRVVWTRTDGGKQVPATVDRAMDLLIPAGGTSSSALFHLADLGALNQAPFPALRPENGGKDPDTGLTVVKFNITTTIFGQTLAGDSVAASATIPFQACFNCGDCQP